MHVRCVYISPQRVNVFAGLQVTAMFQWLVASCVRVTCLHHSLPFYCSLNKLLINSGNSFGIYDWQPLIVVWWSSNVDTVIFKKFFFHSRIKGIKQILLITNV